MDLLRDQPGAWLAPEISAEALAATMVVALSSIQPGMRFEHTFFPAAGFQRDSHEAGEAARNGT